MKLDNIFFVLFCLILSNIALAQQSEGYFFPIRPGDRNYLAGTMGELRATHFHAGLDIKTSGREGLPVYATASGYISRIKISPDGYGNSLYIQHDDGNTSVYAHLLSFDEKMGNYARQKQYEAKSFDVDLFPEKNQFPIKKGQQIALSGNSGSSSGPHLHFEIRDKNQNILNPLKFGFKEIQDDIPPIVQKLGIRAMELNARVNEQYGRFEYEVVRRGTDYYIDKPISTWGELGIELLAHDKLSGASNKNGIPCIEVKLDDQRIFYQNTETLAFSEQRNILIYTNYQVTAQTGRRFAKLYVDDGNDLNFYAGKVGHGIFSINDTLEHSVRINLWDPHGNLSSVFLKLKGNPGREFLPNNSRNSFDKSTWYVDNNTLVCVSEWNGTTPQKATFYANGIKLERLPSYNIGNKAVFLWDLRFSIPDSVNLCSSTEKINLDIMVPSGREISFYKPEMAVNFFSGSLFDTLYLYTNYRIKDNEGWEIFNIGTDLVPLKKEINIQLKPRKNYPNKSKTHIYNTDDQGNFNFLGGKWSKESISANTRLLGAYTILTDTIPPKINIIKQNKDLVSFVINDDLSGVAKYELRVNGEWVLMNYDKKRKLIWSEKLDNKKPFSGEMQLTVWDNAGNQLIHKHKFQ